MKKINKTIKFIFSIFEASNLNKVKISSFIIFLLILTTFIYTINIKSGNCDELFYGIENNVDGTQTIIPLIEGKETKYAQGEVRVTVNKIEINGSLISPPNIENLIIENNGEIIKSFEYEEYLSLTIKVPKGEEINFIKEISKNKIIKFASLHVAGKIE